MTAKTGKKKKNKLYRIAKHSFIWNTSELAEIRGVPNELKPNRFSIFFM